MWRAWRPLPSAPKTLQRMHHGSLIRNVSWWVAKQHGLSWQLFLVRHKTCCPCCLICFWSPILVLTVLMPHISDTSRRRLFLLSDRGNSRPQLARASCCYHTEVRIPFSGLGTHAYILLPSCCSTAYLAVTDFSEVTGDTDCPGHPLHHLLCRYLCVTCNYPARQSGVKKLQSCKDALLACPELVLISGNRTNHQWSCCNAECALP